MIIVCVAAPPWLLRFPHVSPHLTACIDARRVSRRQVVAGAADPHGAALDPGAAERAQPGRPAGQRRGRAVEVRRGGGDPERARLDAPLRRGRQEVSRRRPVRRTGRARAGPARRGGERKEEEGWRP